SGSHGSTDQDGAPTLGPPREQIFLTWYFMQQSGLQRSAVPPKSGQALHVAIIMDAGPRDEGCLVRRDIAKALKQCTARWRRLPRLVSVSSPSSLSPETIGIGLRVKSLP